MPCDPLGYADVLDIAAGLLRIIPLIRVAKKVNPDMYTHEYHEFRELINVIERVPNGLSGLVGRTIEMNM